jgi:teichuronic acid biosynthesis glycosyltransferase TuaG
LRLPTEPRFKFPKPGFFYKMDPYVPKPAFFRHGSQVAGGWRVQPCLTGLMRGHLLKDTPKSSAVSIITPAFNAERFIAETIRSVQSQTHGDWEMLVVDDVSSDRTRDIVSDIAASDSRVRLIAQEENLGPAETRNRGLAEARGRFVAFLDSDDLWLPEKLSKQLTFMRQKNAAMSYTAYRIINEKGELVGRPVRAPANMDYRGLLKNTAIGCLTVILDREQTGPLRMLPLPQHEDLTLWYSILKRGIVAQGIQEDLARYRIVRGSTSRNKVRSARHMWKVYRQVERLSLPDALWCYGHYAWRAYWKNRF